MVNFEHSKELKKDVLSLLHARNKTEKSAFFMSSPSSKFTLYCSIYSHDAFDIADLIRCEVEH